jgi:hypothetical protein
MRLAMSDVTPWIEHLKHPLVLFGFVLLVLATLLKTFSTDKLSGEDTGLLMDKGLLYTFAVAVLIIVLGFISSLVQQQAAAPQSAITQHSEGKQSPNSVGAGVAAERIEQGSKGDQSPNSVGAGAVSVQK